MRIGASGFLSRRQREPRPHPRRQLASAERLDDVVVGAGAEPEDSRVLAGARRQHQDRTVSVRGWRFSSRSSAKPSRPGIITSLTTRSGGGATAALERELAISGSLDLPFLVQQLMQVVAQVGVWRLRIGRAPRELAE